MEPIEYMTMAREGDDVARMLERLNELGAQGWEVCASVLARADRKVIGRTESHVEVLILKRHKAA